MSTVDGTNSATNAGLGQPGVTGTSAQDIQNQFLTLLITQLKNQDPLNPLDNSEVTSQLAQISTVEGINNLRDTMLAISGQIDVSQSMNAVSMIGKGILIPGDKISLGSDPTNASVREATPFGVDLQGDAAKLTIKVMDSSGAVVRTIQVSDADQLKTGILDFTWDGNNDGGAAVPDGKYTFNVNAIDGDGKQVTADALTYGQVGSVSYTTQGLRLDLGLAGKVSMLDVRQILGVDQAN